MASGFPLSPQFATPVPLLVGILWAVLAGLMLGLYALPNKFTKDFKEENTWGLFFMLTMFAVPVVATLLIMKGTGAIFGAPEVRAILPQMILSSVLWGVGVMMWGKATLLQLLHRLCVRGVHQYPG